MHSVRNFYRYVIKLLTLWINYFLKLLKVKADDKIQNNLY